MNEIWETFYSRIKSPFFGYYFFSCISINWSDIYLLFYSEQSAILRVNYFEQGTTYITLLILPFFIALALAIISPWLKLVLLEIGRVATEKTNELQASVQDKKIGKEQDLEKARLEKSRVLQKNIVEEGVIEEEALKKIQDPDVRKKTLERLSEERKKNKKNESAKKRIRLSEVQSTKESRAQMKTAMSNVVGNSSHQERNHAQHYLEGFKGFIRHSISQLPEIDNGQISHSSNQSVDFDNKGQTYNAYYTMSKNPSDQLLISYLAKVGDDRQIYVSAKSENIEYEIGSISVRATTLAVWLQMSDGFEQVTLRLWNKYFENQN